MKSRRLVGGLAALALGGSVLAAAAPALAGSTSTPSFNTEPKPLVEKNSTGDVSAVSLGDAPAPRPEGVSEDAKPASVAKEHLKKYADKFGVSVDDLKVDRSAKLAGGHVVRFNQTIDDVDVFGGQLVTSLNRSDALEFVVGKAAEKVEKTFPDGSDELTGDAIEAAKKVVQKREELDSTKGMQVKAKGKLWYSAKVAGTGDSTELIPVRVAEVTTADKADAINYKVLVNAESGEVELAYNQIRNAINREICDADSAPIDWSDPSTYECGTVMDVTRAEGDDDTGEPAVDDMYQWMHDISVRYASYVNLDVSELLGGKMVATIRACSDDQCPYSNAMWNGYQTVFGENATADDIAGHEFTHGVNQYTNGLEYINESGALDEAIADTWGEIVDLHNGSDDDSEDNAWLIGEGSPGGQMRNMADPTNPGNPDNPAAMPQPDKKSSEYWYTGDQDNGGVHINSGVFNKAAYLLGQEGDVTTEFNGQSVRSIGPAKLAKVTFSLQNMLTSTSTYADVATTMPLACEKYIDAPDSYVTADDCAQVEKAIEATEMAS